MTIWKVRNQIVKMIHDLFITFLKVQINFDWWPSYAIESLFLMDTQQTFKTSHKLWILEHLGLVT
jgi:hypothetical protein